MLLHRGTGAIDKRAQRKLRLQQALLAVTAIALLAVSFLHFRRDPSGVAEAPLRKFSLTPPVHWTYLVPAISPNGKHIALGGGQGGLWIQDLAQEHHSRPIEGTEGAWQPFWSPGSDFVGFFAVGQGEIRKLSVHGGPAIPVCQITGTNDYFRGTWSPDGNSIVFAWGSPPALYEVPASGGTPRPLSLPEQPGSKTESPTGAARSPHFLPSEAGDRVLVFASVRGTEATMVVHDLETGQQEVLDRGGFPFYSPSGHLVFERSFGLWAQPFSLETLKATGEAFPVAEDGRFPTVSTDQTLVYRYTAPRQRQLVWRDRGAKKTGQIGPVGDIAEPELSSDEQRLAYRTTDGDNWDLWVWDLKRGVKAKLSTDPSRDFHPVWSPSGKEVAFSSDRAGIFLKPADGGGEAKGLLATSHAQYAQDWSQNGKYLLYIVEDAETGDDLWYLKRDDEGSKWEPHPFLQTPFHEWAARFSPSGRYVAYTSDQSGQYEVYVQPFPEGGHRTTVSDNGGRKPRWRSDGKELFYLEGNKLMAVSVSTEPSFSAGRPTVVFEHPSLEDAPFDSQYDVSADGQRFVVAEEVGEIPEPSIRVVENWFAEFRGRQSGAQ